MMTISTTCSERRVQRSPVLLVTTRNELPVVTDQPNVQPIDAVIGKWHAHTRGRLPGGLDELLDDDVVFFSPIVFTPQRGKAITKLYLTAAGQALPGERPAGASEGDLLSGAFRYTKEVLAGDTAVLEFETTVEGRYINGVDIIRCNDAGRIIEFRVMIRPLQAVNLVHQQMAAILEQMKNSEFGNGPDPVGGASESP